MRVRFVMIAAIAASLAACQSTPREPAPIQRGGASASMSSAACGAQVTVRRGDTLSAIARRCGHSVQEIASANGLSRPYTLNPGQRLRMPGPSTYTVRRGDNLYRIGLAHGMTTEEIAALNGLRPPFEIHPGQELRVRGQARRVAQAPQRPETANGGAQRPAPPTSQDPAPSPAPAAPVSFAWPLDGAVIAPFGSDQGRRLDGIRIAARVGEPVRAAAAGEVVYVGNELQGYGELVLIRHPERWVTAYGLNAQIRVSVGDQVSAGQHIADAGGAGGGEQPALHFEIRRGVTPVNPEQQLPSR
jgi:murein DD-endopeptidase MepM/ murein hydrolase activator NlpD